MIGFKVVRIFREKLLSAVDTTFEVEYIVGEETYPKLENSRLFFFKTCEDAKQYIKDYGWFSVHEIWKCEANGVGQGQPTNFLGDIYTYWEYKNKKLKNIFSIKKIPGTKSAKSIKLLEKVG